MDTIKQKAQVWLNSPFDLDTKQQVQALINENPEELKDAFYKDLAFGTGGMRGIMGPGTNRINRYTLGKNTQGIAAYLKKTFPNETLKVAIAYDCRHNSQSLAKTVADVFSGNGIEVYLFEELRPTPELSFTVKHLKCHCGIVLTASHNPPEYNGYKVYWQDGGQLVPPQDQEIIAEINQLTYDQIVFEPKPELIHAIGKNLDEAYINTVLEKVTFNTPTKTKKDLSIVFTSLHGTSITLIPKVLKRAGYENLHIVEAQATPNGDFPTVKSPNPEEPEALKMALELAEEVNADIVIGTDPDSDRLGVGIRDNAGKMILLNGNQSMVLMTDFLLKHYTQQQELIGNEFIASTIVSTPLMQKLAEHYQVECKVGLTGFKWIAKMIKDHPNQKFIGGGEESFGYMVGDFVRDKDAVSATLLMCEMAALAKHEDKSIYEQLISLYTTHGLYQEHLVSLVKKGITGAQEIKQMMEDLRANPPKEINGVNVIRLEDYSTSTALDISQNKKSILDIPKSNVLIFYLEDGTKIAARPSGTEPKIKFYISVQTPLADADKYNQQKEILMQKIAQALTYFRLND